MEFVDVEAERVIEQLLFRARRVPDELENRAPHDGFAQGFGAQVVLDYLARYVHRTALSDKAISACDDRSVSFTYRDSRAQRRKTMTLPPGEFRRRFLQHVPLRGLHRVRAFGLLHPAQRSTLRRLQLLLAPRAAPPAPTDGDGPRATRQRPRCPHCHERALRSLRRLSAEQCAAFRVRAMPVAPRSSARGPPSGNLGVPLQ